MPLQLRTRRQCRAETPGSGQNRSVRVRHTPRAAIQRVALGAADVAVDGAVDVDKAAGAIGRICSIRSQLLKA